MFYITNQKANKFWGFIKPRINDEKMKINPKYNKHKKENMQLQESAANSN